MSADERDDASQVDGRPATRPQGEGETPRGGARAAAGAQAHDDGLIPTHETLVPALGPRPLVYFVLAFFLALLVGTSAIDTLAPLPAPRLFGQEKSEDAKVRTQANILDGSSARLLEHDLRLTSPVRRALATPFAIALYRFLNETGADVIAGRDRWIFMRRRADLSLASVRDLVELPAAMFASLDRRLATQGRKLVLAPVPRKAVVCADKLPRGFDPRPEIDAGFYDALVRRGVRTAAIGAAFETETSEPLYFPTDGHWTERAEVLAAEAVARAADMWVEPERRRTELYRDGEKEPEGNTYFFFGIDPDDPRMDWVGLDPIPTYSLRSATGKSRFQFAREEPRVAIAGTSFTARRRFPGYIAHFMQEPVFNGAQAGAFPLAQLLQLLEDPKRADIEVVLVELPLHNVVAPRALEVGAELFSSTRPDQMFELGRVPGLTRRLHEGGGEQAVRRRPQQLARLQQGAIRQSGDGVLAFRVRGRAKGKHVVLSVLHEDDSERLEFPWPADADELVLPILSKGPEHGEVRLMIGGSGSARIDSVDLVCEAAAVGDDEIRLRIRQPERVEPRERSSESESESESGPDARRDRQSKRERADRRARDEGVGPAPSAGESEREGDADQSAATGADVDRGTDGGRDVRERSEGGDRRAGAAGEDRALEDAASEDRTDTGTVEDADSLPGPGRRRARRAWQAQLIPTSPCTIPEHAILLVRFDRSKVFPDAMRVELVTGRGERTFVDCFVESGGLLLHNLSPLAGKPLSRIRIHGEGVMPPRLVDSVQILASGPGEPR